jgi:hypothetical protein
MTGFAGMATGIRCQTHQQRRNEYGNCNRLPETSSAHLMAYGNGSTSDSERFLAHSLVGVLNAPSKCVIYNPKAGKYKPLLLEVLSYEKTACFSARRHVCRLHGNRHDGPYWAPFRYARLRRYAIDPMRGMLGRCNYCFREISQVQRSG